MIDEELQQCAEVITQLDQKMLEVRKKKLIEYSHIIKI